MSEIISDLDQSQESMFWCILLIALVDFRCLADLLIVCHSNSLANCSLTQNTGPNINFVCVYYPFGAAGPSCHLGANKRCYLPRAVVLHH